MTVVAPILTSAEMRAAEKAAMARGIAGAVLMERAGHAVLEAVRAHWPARFWAPGQAAVLAGPGNNGGDGYVIARLLLREGWDVRLFALDPARALPPDAAAARTAFEAAGGRVEPLAAFGPDMARGRLVFDAVFGTGLARPIPLVVARALDAAAAGGAGLVAVDILSGLDADTGALLAPADMAAVADLTVTFEAPRRGHYLGEGPKRTRGLAIRPIGIAEDVAALAARETGVLGEIRAGTVPLEAPVPRDPLVHKYQRGHLLVIGGGSGKGGAARLAARAALRFGAGLVTLGVPAAAIGENAARLDAVMLTTCESGEDLARTVRERKIAAIVIGPGLGRDARGRALLEAALAADLPLVLDADALSLMAERTRSFFARLRDHPLRRRIVLTPHMGEFRRLFPRLLPADGRPIDRVALAGQAAEEAGAVVVLKRAATLVAVSGARPLLHPALYERAAPWLATAGAGDVLSGMIGALLAAGREGREAAAVAIWCHVEAARLHGPGLVAEDLERMLPAILSRLLEGGVPAGRPGEKISPAEEG